MNLKIFFSSLFIILCGNAGVAVPENSDKINSPNIVFILAGVEKPGQIPDGKSILTALLDNKFNPERAIFRHYPVYHHDVPASAVRKGDWKLIQNLVTRELSLYNLRADISEAMDLAELFPKKATELANLLRDWQKKVKAEFPKPNPNFDKSRRFEWGIYPDRQP